MKIQYILRSLSTNADKLMKLCRDKKATCILITFDNGLCKKKYTVIDFYKPREVVVAAVSICPYHLSSKENRSDFLMKATGQKTYNIATNGILK